MTTGRWNLLDNIFAKLWKIRCFSLSFEANLVTKAWGDLRGAGEHMCANLTKLPLLIIDGLAQSVENKTFIGSLCKHVRDANISAPIMVKEETWADELTNINSGIKILPVDQVINNPQGVHVEHPFTAELQWKKCSGGLRTSPLLWTWKESLT